MLLQLANRLGQRDRKGEQARRVCVVLQARKMERRWKTETSVPPLPSTSWNFPGKFRHTANMPLTLTASSSRPGANICRPAPSHRSVGRRSQRTTQHNLPCAVGEAAAGSSVHASSDDNDLVAARKNPELYFGMQQQQEALGACWTAAAGPPVCGWWVGKLENSVGDGTP